MGDDDHVAAVVPCSRSSGGRRRGRQVVPAFAAGGADVAGVFPEGADQGGVFAPRLRRRRAPSQAPKWISRRAGSWGRRGAGAERVGGGDGADQVGRDDGRSAGSGRDSRARAAVSDRSAGRSVQPIMAFAWVGPWRTHQRRVMPAPGRAALQHQRQARHDADDQLGLGREALVQPARASRNRRAKRVVGNNSPADLVRHDDDRGRAGGKGGKQGRRFRPSRSCSASRWLVSHSVAQSISTTSAAAAAARAAGRSSGASTVVQSPPRSCAVPGDPVAHLVIPGLGGGDVAAGAAGCGDQPFGKGGFARPGAADDKSQLQGQVIRSRGCLVEWTITGGSAAVSRSGGHHGT